MNSTLVRLLSATCLSGAVFAASPVLAQTAPAAPAAPAAQQDGGVIIVTGSSIRRRVETSALPLQVITPDDLRRDSISSPEMLVQSLSTNVGGVENLAANADVTPQADSRSARGASFANLRGQGASGTLVLLNGRRVAAHGLSGGAVDLNQLPLAAMTRVDVLKDGASAVYGTDAIGGVINFITRTDFEGINASVSADVTGEGGGNIYRGSLLVGYGDLEEQNFNIMGVVSYRQNEELTAKERDWITGFDERRGLSIDTRGTPFATIFPLGAPTTSTNPLTNNTYSQQFIPAAGTVFGSAGTSPFIPGTNVRASGGVNVLDIPGKAGCSSIEGQSVYREDFWNDPTRALACAYNTSQSVSLQQEQETTNYFVRGVADFGGHQLSAEYMASDATAFNRFSELQFSSNTTTPAINVLQPNGTFSLVQTANAPPGDWDNGVLPIVYTRTAANAAIYDGVIRDLRDYFGTDPRNAAFISRLDQNLPLAFRWRCLECGRRELTTETQTERMFIGLDGPMWLNGWTYRVGASLATSESATTLGQGYFFNNSFGSQRGFTEAFNSGVINPFRKPGEAVTPAALDALASASAAGTVLFGGVFEVTQYDGSVSGPLFDLPGGTAYMALGLDVRSESWEFNGDRRAAASRGVILGAPFDDANALPSISRDIQAVFAEVFLPILPNLELTIAGRRDEYDGFGETINPKISLRWKPAEFLTFRGSYNTGFRVPSFNQIYNRVTEFSLAVGNAVVDPRTCPSGVAGSSPGCADLTVADNRPPGTSAPIEITGGNLNLQPEEAEQMSFGAVLNFAQNASLTIDWWRIERTNEIATSGFLSRQLLTLNYPLFTDRFIYGPQGNLTIIDRRNDNVGGTLTEGVEISLRNNGEIWGGRWSAGMDGTWLLNRQRKLLPTSPYTANEVGFWSFYADVPLTWRHNVFVSYRINDWSMSLSQNYRSGYKYPITSTNLAPGVANGLATGVTDFSSRIDSYTLYNTSLSYSGFENFRVTFGIRNLLDTTPPFVINYDSNSGAGGNWDPRVTDPRGRSFTLTLDYEF